MSALAVNLDRLLEPVAAAFSPEVAARIANLRADEAMQSRVDYLADRANEGLLAPDEREEYETYLRVADLIAVLQAKARAQLHRHD